MDHLGDAGVVGPEEQESLACVRRTELGHGVRRDDARNASKSPEGLANMMSVIVTGYEAAGLAMSETKTETMLLQSADQTTLAPPLVIGAARRPEV